MATTANGTAKRTNPRGTKKYKALIAAKFSDAEALGILGVTGVQPKDAPAVEDPTVAELIAGGFSPEQAESLVAKRGEPKAKKGKDKKAKKAKASEALSSKDQGEALVAQQGLMFTRGRVYMTGEIVEAVVRVLKGAKPQVVASSGVGHVAAVLVYREDSGDVAVQNLKKPV